MWHGILGHDAIVEHFRRTLAAGRLASTYLFVGPPGVGKKRLALELAKCLLCPRLADAELEACGECDSCRLFDAGNHPDLEVIGLEAGRSDLRIEQFVGDHEHRNQEGLCHRFALKPYLSSRRVAVIDDADCLNASSANCLLKTLEEPPPHSLLILIGTSPALQLPTIRSRAQAVRFRPLAKPDVAQVLLAAGVANDRQQAARIAEHSDGSMERATKLADPALEEFRAAFQRLLAGSLPDGARLARLMQTFVDDAGKEASLKRDRLRIALSFAVEQYRANLRQCTPGAPQVGTAAPGAAAAFSTAHGSPDAMENLRVLDACLEALDQIDRNANLGLVIQQWCQELPALSGTA
jgi:DNA polymerase-3 subunit delta'